MSKRIKTFLLIILPLIATSVFAQSAKSNFSAALYLVKKIAGEQVAPALKDSGEYYFEFSSPKEFNILKSPVITALKERGVRLSLENKGVRGKLVFSIENISTQYSNAFRKNFWSAYKVKRKISASGSYLIYSLNKIIKANNFSSTITDTVNYNSIKSLELPSVPFTRGQMPQTPLFTGVFEPIIALAAVLISVYLLFSVRSK